MTTVHPHPASPAPLDAEPTRDVLVVGGGAAGLSAALTLARARRDVLVVDAGAPRNAPAAGVHGYLTRDGVAPAELTRLGRAEVESYGGEVRPGTVTGIVKDEGAAGGAPLFHATVTTVDGRDSTVSARRVIVTTGLTDELPDVAGLRERWGRDVVHCPYCHGWEVRDRAIGVLGGGPMSVHQALLFRQWSDRVTLFVNGGPEPTDEQAERLAARGVAVVRGRVSGLRVDDDRLTGFVLDSGEVEAVEVGVAGAPVRPNAELLTPLGVSTVPHPSGMGLTVDADPATGATSVPGLWLAGNVADITQQVVMAAGSGVRAAALANADLIEEEIVAAVAARRAGPASADDREYWEGLYSGDGMAWSGRPNAPLVAETADLAPGRALDLGSGEGGDAIWLARRGWRVTGVDIAEAALAKAGRQAREVAPEAAGRIDWQQRDLTTWSPAEHAFDLVSTHFLHLPDPARSVVFRALARAVAPGGTLLVVGHDVSEDAAHRGHHPELMFTADDVLAAIEGEGLVVEVAESRVRAASAEHPASSPLRDVVVRARRA